MSYEAINIMRGIFVDEDIQATPESLRELSRLFPGESIFDDEKRQSFFISEIEGEEENCFVFRKSFDKEVNVSKYMELKDTMDMSRLIAETRALGTRLKRTKVIYTIFSLMRAFVNNNVSLVSANKIKNDCISSTDNIKVFSKLLSLEGEDYISMSVVYSDNNMEFEFDLRVHVEDHEKSHVIQKILV